MNLSYFSYKSFTQMAMEAMQKIDFKIGKLKTNLIQMGLSPLAAWPLAVWSLVFYFDPTRTSWSLQGFLMKTISETNGIGYWLFDSSISHLIVVGILFFLLEWLFRIEYWLVSIILFLQGHGDVHVLFSLAAIVGIYLAQTSYLWWFYVELKGQTKRIWIGFTATIYSALAISLVIMCYVYLYLKTQGYFSVSIHTNRYEFIVLSLFVIYAVRLFFTLIWGHFINRTLSAEKPNPDEIKVYYSTVTWLLRYKMKPTTKSLLKVQTESLMDSYKSQADDLKMIKDQSLGVLPLEIQKSFNLQYEYLKLASQRLSIED